MLSIHSCCCFLWASALPPYQRQAAALVVLTMSDKVEPLILNLEFLCHGTRDTQCLPTAAVSSTVPDNALQCLSLPDQSFGFGVNNERTREGRSEKGNEFKSYVEWKQGFFDLVELWLRNQMRARVQHFMNSLPLFVKTFAFTAIREPPSSTCSDKERTRRKQEVMSSGTNRTHRCCMTPSPALTL